MAYTRPFRDTAGVLINTDVFLVSSDDNGQTWNAPVRVNSDTAADNFSEGNRWQFHPAVTVDPLTGTVVVMWYDARTDATDGRAAVFLSTSIDGGQTFGPAVFLNTPKQA